MTNQIKRLRESRGLTQSELAEETHLSLRTIQRVEGSARLPKGNTLKRLEDFFQLELKQDYLIENEYSLSKVKMINFSVLFFIILPLLHIALPLSIWKWGKNEPSANGLIKPIINFQIHWIASYIILVIIFSFFQATLDLGIPLVFFVILTLMLFNLIVVVWTANNLSKNGRLPKIVQGRIQLL